MTTMNTPAHSTTASMLRKVPITATTIDGVLTLDDGRLSFATRRRTYFDHPVGEFHSVAPAAHVGFHLWHGERRYRFVPGPELVSGVNTGGTALDLAAGVAQATAAQRRMRDARDHWLHVLGPLVGSPPPGVTVRPPWPTWATWASVVTITVVLIAVITAVVVLAG